MKALVLSDSHGHMDNIRKVLGKERNVDMVIHLGDILTQAGEFLGMCEGMPILVRGNCDFFSDAPYATVFNIGPKRVFATHGHLYGVKYSYDRLYYAAYEQKCDIALFGHTHEAMLAEDEKVTLFNPGSISMPRRYKDKPTYGIIEVNEESGECNFYIQTVE